MCNPVLGVMAAGALVSAYGAKRNGQEANNAAQFNANQTEIEALDTIERGNNEEARYRREISQIIGSQRAAFGARNVKVEGTALDLLNDTTRIGEQDALTIRSNTNKEVRGLYSQASELRRQGRAAKKNSLFQAGGTLLTSGASAYGSYAKGLG